MHGFPVLGLLRVLRPTLTASTGDESSRRPTGCWPVTGPSKWFPRSLSNRSTGSAPNYAPATSPRLRRRHSPWPPDRRHHPIQEFPDTTSPPCGCALLPSPDPPGSSWWFRLEERSAVGSLSLRLSVLLAGPGPSGSAGLSRLCQGSHPHPGNHAALSFNQPAATSWRRCPFITARFESASWRSMSVTHNDPARCGRSRDRRGRPMSACHDVSCVDGFLVGPRSRPVSWTSRRRCGRR